MVGCLDFLVLANHHFHLVLQELFQEEVRIADVDPLLLFLQFLTHSLHHHLLDLPVPLLPLH